ncbi:hypothetical protein BDV96DRAFT_579283 [Lophiotrema nucula]|uniref:F-box domain-containing protein n=1 Tax=Lophiotrema nucula TaxID=690887 RepID=A0A6A5Z0C3_9PLEO|nr:hypothetical protein BDV96DRAFT_579283 [Lophiotrema nucula]
MASTNVQLPPCIARHLNLGFDSDDINALISSIDSSQNCNSSESETRLPQLPTEIIVNILHFVPVNYVLDWRLVCRGFRDVIDTAVMFSYLPRVRLIGYVGPSLRPEYLRFAPGGGDVKVVSANIYEEVQLLHADFNVVIEDGITSQECAKWSAATEAYYRIDDRWFEKFEDIGGSATDRTHSPLSLRRVLSRLELEQNFQHDYGAVRWCIKLDHCVMDLETPLTPTGKSSPFLAVNLRERKIKVSWKDMIWQFLKTENSVRKKMEQSQDSTYTFCHEEDCLRYVRRLRTRHGLDLTNASDRTWSWVLGTLKPLFNIERRGRAGDAWDALERIEDESAGVLMQLRREASSTSAQRASLIQLGRDKKDMVQEGDQLGALFATWRNNLYYSSESFRRPSGYLLPSEVSPNPFAWSEAVRHSIEEEVARWKSQQKGIEQIKSFLQSSNEVLEAPDDVWDNSGMDW